MISRLFFSLLLLSLFACFPEVNEDPHRIGPSYRLKMWTVNQQFWATENDKPILLLGTANGDNQHLSPDFPQKLKELHKAGGNYVCNRLSLTTPGQRNSFTRDSLANRYDYLKPDSIYWTELHSFIRYAASLNINVQLILPTANSVAPDDEFFEAMTYQAIAISHNYGNVFYAIENKPDRTVLPKSVPELRRILSRANAQAYSEDQPRIFAIPSVIPEDCKTRPTHSSAVDGNDPYDVIKNFNLAVMNGYAGLCYAPSRASFEMRGARLASIRAIRTVERHLKFWDLKPAPEILIGDNAHAATDGKGNYLFYMPTAGEVNVRLPVEDQVPIRVVVVGYLGTQKSELLQPPYGDSFKLFTDEIRGGWMILKREE